MTSDDLLTRLRARLATDRGSALIVTVAVTGILSLLVGVAFSVARNSIDVRDDVNRTHGALAAAEAGLDDYIFRLNNVDEYWTYNHADDGGNDAFVANAADHANIPADAWTPVAGGGEFGEYVYSVDTSDLVGEGVIRITSTGRVVPRADGQADLRTVTATVKQASFLDFLYFTDYETLDPEAYSTAADRAWAAANCRVRRWQGTRPTSGRPSSSSQGCVEIFWASGDVVNGPFHTNDRWRISGNPRWTDDVSGSAINYASNGFYDGSGSPVFATPPFYQAPLEMPPSNSALRSEADHTIGGEGCLYTGPTEIVLNPNGTIRLDSPYTRRSGAGCGNFSGNGNDAPQTVSLPQNGVIYVQAIPANPSDPNYTAGCPHGDNGLGYPWSTYLYGGYYFDDELADYSCRDGDAFVEGTLNGRLTVGAQNDVVITWHLRYQGTDDMLGLIANDYVQVYHPVDPDYSRAYQNMPAGPRHPTATFQDPQINAAVLSVGHSFMVQRWAYGNGLGSIRLNGAIAQIFRGPVGTFSGSTQVSGYDKDYNYDPRLRYTNPPHFIDPVKASWRVLQFAEQFPS